MTRNEGRGETKKNLIFSQLPINLYSIRLYKIAVVIHTFLWRGASQVSTSIFLPPSPLPVTVNQTDHAVLVHNNFIQGHANKVQRFKNKGLK